MPGYHLAQLNIANLAAPLDSPPLADFVANLQRINALAEASPGFVWRLADEGAPCIFIPIKIDCSIWLHDSNSRLITWA